MRQNQEYEDSSSPQKLQSSSDLSSTYDHLRKQTEVKNEVKYKTCDIYKLGIVISISAWSCGYEIAAFNPTQKAISDLLGWGDLSEVLIATCTALFPLGGIFGAIIGGWMGTQKGRRYALLVFTYIQSVVILLNLIPNTYTFAICRFASGICSGNALLIAPIYLAEISPKALRGKICLLFPIAIGLGSFLALGLGIPLGFGVNPWYWLFLFGFALLPQIYQILAFKFAYIYDSPVWLLEKGDDDQAKKGIEQLYDESCLEEVYQDLKFAKAPKDVDLEKPLIKGSLKEEEALVNISVKQLLCTRRYRKIATLGICIEMFNILGGYNSLVFYSNKLLEDDGQSPGIASIGATGLALANGIFNICAFPSIDSYGRRPLLLLGIAGMTISMTILGFFSLLKFPVYAQIVMMVVFLFCFSHSSGPVGWVYVADIMNLNGILLASIVYWISLALLGACFPFAESPSGINIYGVFWCFAIINLSSFFFILFYAPETKGKDKREISKMLEQN